MAGRFPSPAFFVMTGLTALDAPFAQEEQLYREQQHQYHCRELHHLECDHNGCKGTHFLRKTLQKV